MTDAVMSSISEPWTLRGSCHCGEVRVELTTRLAPASLVPRACDCTFCRKQGAAYLSDPSGRMRISARHADSVNRIRQGSDSAEFLLCRRCGVLVAVIVEHASRVYGATNAGCLDDPPALGDPVAVSPRRLTRDEKLTRWMQLWCPDVEWTTGDG